MGKNDPESVHCSGLRNVMKRRPCVPVCAVDLGSPLEEEVCNGGVTHDYSDMQRRVLHVPSFLLDICACIEQPNHFCDVVVEHCRIERWKGRHKAFVPCPVTVSFIVFFQEQAKSGLVLEPLIRRLRDPRRKKPARFSVPASLSIEAMSAAAHINVRCCRIYVQSSSNRSRSAAILCTGWLDVIPREAWSFCSTSSSVRLCWELEEPKGPKGSQE